MGKKERDTIELQLFQAYLAAVECLRSPEDGLIDFELLRESGKRVEFAHRFFSSLEGNTPYIFDLCADELNSSIQELVDECGYRLTRTVFINKIKHRYFPEMWR